ncbi:MAG: hemolysin family protein [Verrucomicrobia bacterium]|nr:hemolysin family protein [Verrucomicrobiota bacterium]
MDLLITAIVITLGLSAICSLLEAFILSSSTAEVEALKRERPRMGLLLEKFKHEMHETSSAILTLNTVANTAGSIVVGALAADVFDSKGVGILSAVMVFGILVFSEILPKNLGFTFRKEIQVYVIYPLLVVRFAMKPFSWMAKKLLQKMLHQEVPTEEEQEQEILLLAEKSAETGALQDSERTLISNALTLDNIAVEEIMTPRTVVTFLSKSSTVADVCRDFRNIPFARLPVYGESLDDIHGVVRRRDILQASSEDKEHLTVESLMQDVLFVPETASALDALEQFLKKHQQFAVVVDEFGSTAGVVTMEDVVEHLIGREIYEDSDLAVDMRELAKKRAEKAPPLTSLDS